MSTLSPVNKCDRGVAASRHQPTRLAERIAAHIRAHGPITFRDFMERALYEPGRGYYARARTAWAESADFLTAPQVDAAFGIAVASLVRACDYALGTPAGFDLVEMGGGDGALLRDTCDALARHDAELYRRLRIVCIERGDAARAQQRERLAGHADRARWLDTLEQLPEGSLCGLLFSNELLDAFPVHRVRWRAGRLRELLVDVDERGFVEREADPTGPALAAYLRDNDVTLQEGQVAEICLAVDTWVAAVAQRLRRGFVLTVDYGADTQALYGPGREGGSLVCQHRFQLNASPYERIGEQDITAHVDLGNLRRCGAARGLQTAGVAGLAVFLLGFGAADSLVPHARDDRGAAAHARRTLGLRHLLLSEIADAHRAVLQYKDVAPIPFGRERL